MVQTQRQIYTDELSRRILEAVAECHGVEPEEIDARLEEWVDTESLNSLWPPDAQDQRTVHGVTSFFFYECRVTVSSDGTVEAVRI